MEHGAWKMIACIESIMHRLLRTPLRMMHHHKPDFPLKETVLLKYQISEMIKEIKEHQLKIQFLESKIDELRKESKDRINQ